MGFDKILEDTDFVEEIKHPDFFFLASGAYYQATLYPEFSEDVFKLELKIDRSVMCIEKAIELYEKADEPPRPRFFLAAANVYSRQGQIKSQIQSQNNSQGACFGADLQRDLALQKACEYSDIYINHCERSGYYARPEIYLDAANAYLAKAEIQSWDEFFDDEYCVKYGSFRYWAERKANEYFETYWRAIGLKP